MAKVDAEAAIAAIIEVKLKCYMDYLLSAIERTVFEIVILFGGVFALALAAWLMQYAYQTSQSLDNLEVRSRT